VARTIRAKADTLSVYPNRYRAGRIASTRELVVKPNYVVVYRVVSEDGRSR
jgi:toxin ParE1/3/4